MKSHADCIAAFTVSLSFFEYDLHCVMRLIALVTTSLVAGNVTWAGSLTHLSKALNVALIRGLPAAGSG